MKYNLFRNLFRRKPSLRDKCVAEYGEEFGEMYDALNMGEPIGGFVETIVFLDKLEKVRKEMETERTCFFLKKH